MQPTILQMLQDQAKDRLKEAEVPLLSSEDSDTVDRTRLVFTVTLNKRTDTAPAILVESKLYERVRLWRDPAKEMELATWAQSGVGGPRITNEMLFQVFDGQLNQFIKAYREVNPNPTRAESAGPNSPVHHSDNSNALQWLNGITVFVSFRPDVLADAAQRAELQKTLQREAEEKLVKAGIPLLKWVAETERAGHPLLYIFITLSRPNSDRHAIEVESAFWQQVRPVRDPRKETSAVTWESEASDGWPISDEAVLKVLNNQLDEFIKAYRAANSKLSAVRQ